MPKITKAHLKLAVYWVQHQFSIPRHWDLNTVDLDVLGVMSQQHDLEGQIPEAPSALVINVKDWPKAFELICEHLDQHCGLICNWLSYFVRALLLLQVQSSADDPISGYVFLDLEMIVRAPSLKAGTTGDASVLKLTGPFDPTFLTDFVKVNEILVVMIQPTLAWVYMKPKRGVDPKGHRSYMLIFEHFLGPGNMDHLARNASSRLQHVK